MIDFNQVVAEIAAFEAGWDAAAAGKVDASNPFPDGTQQKIEWSNGWHYFHECVDRELDTGENPEENY